MSTIPRVIHQTWRDGNLPPVLAGYRATWQRFHPDWEYRLWTDADNAEFIARHYPWFLPVYRAYPREIMRVDAVRYFLLHHYGGVYIDLDFECLQAMDPLLTGRTLLFGQEPELHVRYHAAAGSQLNRIVCNAWMACVPGHAFWRHLFRVLQRNAGCPDTLDATGPMMLTRAVAQYPHQGEVGVLPADILYPMDKAEKNRGAWLDPVFRSAAAERAVAVHHWHASWLEKMHEPS